MIISQMSNNDEYHEALETNMNKSSKIMLWSRKNQQSNFANDRVGWKFSAFRIIYLVSKFLRIIRAQKSYHQLDYIAKTEFNLIRDSASDYNFYRYKGYFMKDKPSYLLMKWYKWLSCILRHQNNFVQQNHQKWLLRPDDTIMILWNIYLILMVTINVFYVSLRLSFPEIQDVSMPQKEFIFEQLPVYSYFLDIALKFNTCIYYKGNLIVDRVKIVTDYVTSGFVIDLILVLPFFVGQRISFGYFDVVVVLKVFQLSSLFSSLFNRLELSPKQTALFDLFKLISSMILVAHFSACIWHIIGKWGEWGNDSGKTWIKVALLQDESWIDRYVVSFYWSIVTMTTIGYGDITPVNLTERIYVIFMTMISSATFAYTVNNIGCIFQDFSKQSVQLKNNMNSLNRFLRSQNVSSDLQIKFRRYFEYLWSKPSQKVIQFADLIPKTLKDQMIVDVNIKILNQIVFFRNFSQPLLHRLCMHLEEKQIQAEDYLFQRNKKPLHLYILVTGEVQLIVNLKSKQRILEKIETPQFIGQLDFFLNQIYTHDAVALKTTKILHISRESLYEIFKDFPEDYEVYQQLTEDIVYRQQLSHISIKCNTCKMSNHFTNACPYLFGTPNRTKALYNYRRFVPVDRIPRFERNNIHRKLYALRHHFIVMESVLNFMMKNEDVIQIEGIKELQNYQLVQLQQQQSNHFSFQQIPILSVQHSNGSFQPGSQQKPSSGKLHSSGNLLPPLQLQEDSPRTFRVFNPQNTVKLYRKCSMNYGSQTELPNIDDEVPTQDKLPKQGNDSLQVVNDIQPQTLQLQVPSNSLRRKSVRLKLNDDSSEEEQEDEKQYIMGQYIDIFQCFEKMKEYTKYNPENNISVVVAKFQEKRMLFQRQQKKRKSRRQETLLHLLKQAQGKQRL